MRFLKKLFKAGKHYSVYVIRLDNRIKQFEKVFDLNRSRDLDKPCIYVGMTGLKVSERFKNHMSGYKSSSWVHKYGIALMPSLYEHLNPMTYKQAVKMEVDLAEDLRRRGYTVLGGH